MQYFFSFKNIIDKTYTLLSFGKEHYKNVVYFSLEESADIRSVFERDLDPHRIVKELARNFYGRSGRKNFMI